MLFSEQRIDHFKPYVVALGMPFPPSLLEAVKQIGMPSQATDLTFLSIVSKVRAAHLTSQNISVNSKEIGRFYNGFYNVARS
jgi:hypothetical protein